MKQCVILQRKITYFEQEFYVKGKFYLSYFKAIRNQYDEIERVVVVCSDITRLKRRENVLCKIIKNCMIISI